MENMMNREKLYKKVKDKEIMQLIYRGHIYNYTPPASKAYVKPCALNWRYQVAGETYQAQATVETTQYIKPRALNWRYQMSLAI